MFDIGWSELLVIGVVALIAIGPKELPGVLRMVGQWMGKIRRMASEFQGQFQEAMREAEMADIKQQVDDMTSAASSVASFDPIGDIGREFESAIEDKPKSAETSQETVQAEPQVATAPPAPEAAAPADTAAPVEQDNRSAPAAPSEAEAPAPQPKVGSG
jgi:sec-independent protein translocase protein TatB